MNLDSPSGLADSLVEEALIQAHQVAAEAVEGNQKHEDIAEDTPTEVTDSYYDADEVTKSKTMDSEAAQQAKGW